VRCAYQGEQVDIASAKEAYPHQCKESRKE
jgi:hypothetical protein